MTSDRRGAVQLSGPVTADMQQCCVEVRVRRVPDTSGRDYQGQYSMVENSEPFCSHLRQVCDFLHHNGCQGS
jgi:hypothetical protein